MNPRAVLLMISLLPVCAQASLIYDIKFKDKSGPAGTGSFEYTSCTDVATCPALDFDASFGTGLLFQTTQLGGNADALLAFFLGTSSELGTNFDSADFLSLLSFESSGDYCIRRSIGASGSCGEDPGVFATGKWKVQPVPEPGSLALLLAGLIGLRLARLRVWAR